MYTVLKVLETVPFVALKHLLVSVHVLVLISFYYYWINHFSLDRSVREKITLVIHREVFILSNLAQIFDFLPNCLIILRIWFFSIPVIETFLRNGNFQPQKFNNFWFLKLGFRTFNFYWILALVGLFRNLHKNPVVVGSGLGIPLRLPLVHIGGKNSPCAFFG